MIEGSVVQDLPWEFGQQVSLEVVTEARCTGYEKGGVYHPCPDRSPFGARLCPTCKKLQGMPAAQYCDGYNLEMFSPVELESLNADHYLYVAFFDHDLMKIGVSSQARGLLRQIEQGSHATAIIARGMWGVPARQMETIIRRSGMQDKVQSSQKTASLTECFPEDEVRFALEEITQKTQSILQAQRPESSEFLLSEPEVHVFWQEYHLDTLPEGPTPELLKLQPGESVSGTLLAAKGAYVFLEADGELYALSMRELRGKIVDLRPTPPGVKRHDMVQAAFF